MKFAVIENVGVFFDYRVVQTYDTRLEALQNVPLRGSVVELGCLPGDYELVETLGPQTVRTVR